MKYYVSFIILIIPVCYNAQVVLPAYQGTHYQKATNCGTVTDYDGNVYQTVIIGNQCWMTENLQTTSYSDGSEINSSYIFDYNSDANISAVYGKLYNWYAAMNGEVSSNSNPSGIQGVCPIGWHLPSDTEWQELEIYLGMSIAEANLNAQLRGDIGGKLKEEGETHWSNPNTGATNESDFSALPAGCRNNVGTFSGLTLYTFFWSSTSVNTGQSQYRALYHDSTAVFRGPHSKVDGKSIRCIKD